MRPFRDAAGDPFLMSIALDNLDKQARTKGGPVAYKTVTDLVNGAHRGESRAIGRLISMVEKNSPHLREAITAMAPDTGYCHVVGITGSPGVGKSTLTSALITAWRARGQRVGVLAVDPSSPFTGGAVLGDRVRMQKHATDQGVYIRSMATRGHLGGLAAAAPQALRVFDAARFDTVIVETVGVGQSEVEIAGAADTTLVLSAPGMGDSMQIAKAGVLEIADIHVVNKADHEGAQQLVQELRSLISQAQLPPGAWVPPVVRTIGVRDEGIDDLVRAIAEHREHEQTSAAWQERRLKRAKSEVESLVLGVVRQRFMSRESVSFAAIATSVRDGQLDPYSAADLVLARMQPAS